MRQTAMTPNEAPKPADSGEKVAERNSLGPGFNFLLALNLSVTLFGFASSQVEHGIGADPCCERNRTSRLRFWAVAAK